MVVEKKRLRRPKKAPQPLKEITNLTKALFLFVPMIISFIAYNVLYVVSIHYHQYSIGVLYSLY